MLHHLTAPAPSPHHLATLHPVNARSDTLLRLEQRHSVFRKKIKSSILYLLLPVLFKLSHFCNNVLHVPDHDKASVIPADHPSSVHMKAPKMPWILNRIRMNAYIHLTGLV